MKKAGLIQSPNKGIMVITSQGKEVMNNPSSRIDNKFLMQFDSFKSFIKPEVKNPDENYYVDLVDETNDLTPEERIKEAYNQYRNTLSDDLLERILQSSPSFFEHLVIDLLVAMGYGGSREDAAEHLGGPGDEGIDGLIKQDKLGLDSIVIQAKRYATGNNISFDTMTAFAGAMVGKNAHKGVFITTSDFTKPCVDFAKSCQKKIVLINGTQLTNLMIDYGIGVSTIQTIELKQIDSDYFDDE